jgi:hypothetical protein
MARIRTIKPEFPQSESTGRLSRDARLLFIQLWTVADDSGRARAASRMLASLLYPYDDGEEGRVRTSAADVDRWLDELERERCIRRYEVDGTHYLEITNWQEHQKIDRPSASRLPAPSAEKSRALAKDREPSSTDLGPRTVDKDLGPSIGAIAHATAADAVLWFEAFWKEYPKRDGANPKQPAAKKFLAAIIVDRKPHEPTADAIIAGARRYAAECQRKGIAATDKVAQALTWLNQHRWGDYAEGPADPGAAVGAQIRPDTHPDQWQGWRAHKLAAGQSVRFMDSVGNSEFQKFSVPSEWPPGHLLADLEPPTPSETLEAAE